MTLANAGSASAAVTFSPAYTGPGVPVVVAGYGSALTSLPRVIVGAYNVSNTGFSASVLTADGQSYSASRIVNWFAFKAPS